MATGNGPRPLEPLLSLDLPIAADFCRSFAAVVAWTRLCDVVKRGTPTQWIYRSDVLRPPAWRVHVAQGSPDPTLNGPLVDLAGPFDDVRRDVWRVVAERERQLDALRVMLPSHDSAWSLAERCGGALLAYLPDWNLCDGAAPNSSEAFFDVNNVPPWDTWIDLVRTQHDNRDAMVLVTWAPPAYVELARAGIEVNPEVCILFAALPGSG